MNLSPIVRVSICQLLNGPLFGSMSFIFIPKLFVINGHLFGSMSFIFVLQLKRFYTHLLCKRVLISVRAQFT